MMTSPHLPPSDTAPSATAPDGWAEKLELIVGHVTAGESRLYARLDGLDPAAGWHLSGSIHGPECRFAQTLPATYKFHDRGPGPTLLAEAFVPDPCFWSPALPQVYRATIELRRADRAAAACSAWSASVRWACAAAIFSGKENAGCCAA